MGRSTQKNAGFQGVKAKEGLQMATEQQAWRARAEDFKVEWACAEEMWN